MLEKIFSSSIFTVSLFEVEFEVFMLKQKIKKSAKCLRHKNKLSDNGAKEKSKAIDLEVWSATTINIPKIRQKPIVSLEKQEILSTEDIRNVVIHKFHNTTFGHFPQIKALTIRNNDGVDYKTAKKMDIGKYPIDCELDLHNMTQQVAYNRLIYFVEEAFYNRKRMLLIVTGKGKRSTTGLITLKEMLPEWLNAPVIRNKILRYSNAAKEHGGGGAFYILLKKNSRNFNKSTE